MNIITVVIVYKYIIIIIVNVQKDIGISIMIARYISIVYGWRRRERFVWIERSVQTHTAILSIV